MFTIQLHRDNGPDEDYEAEDSPEVWAIVREARKDSSVRRIVVLTPSGNVCHEVVR